MNRKENKEKLIAVLMTAAICLSVMGALNRAPLPTVHFGMNKVTAQRECIKVVREDRDGNKVDHACSTIDLENDQYTPVNVMDDMEIAEIKMAAAR